MRVPAGVGGRPAKRCHRAALVPHVHIYLSTCGINRLGLHTFFDGVHFFIIEVVKMPSWRTVSSTDNYQGPPRNIASIDQLNFDSHLQPPYYDIAGTPLLSKILFLDVEILEATGHELYRGDVLVAGTMALFAALEQEYMSRVPLSQC